MNLSMKTVIKGYKYRIYPTKEQEIQLAKTFGCCRFVYNQMLAKKIELYKTEKKSLSKFDSKKYMTNQLKKEYPWLKEVDKFALENSIFNLQDAYQKFLRSILDFLNLNQNIIIIIHIQPISQTIILKYCLMII